MIDTATRIGTALDSLPHDPKPSASGEGRVAVMAAMASAAAFLLVWQRGDLLLYGDAVAHIGIARRVVDSLTPGLGQLGTVWLPLPHLLLIPFIALLRMWQVGAAASAPSLIAYVFAVVGCYRLTRLACLGWTTPPIARASAWLAAVIFAANPSLLYLQTTAMTEPLYLAFFVWAVVWLMEFAGRLRGAARRCGHALLACGVLLFAGAWTRYDGWFVIPFFVLAAGALVWRSRRHGLWRSLAGFVAVTMLAPLLWLGWNWQNYGNPLEFATGQYSARAIEQRSRAGGAPAHPGEGAPVAAAAQFARSVQLTLGEKRWGVTLFWAAVAAAALVIVQAARR